MEDDKKLWSDCLSLIREKIANEHIFGVWFSDIRMEKYDSQRHTLLLRIPSRYVYEYLEERYVDMLRAATTEVFHDDITLQYRVVEKAKTLDFSQTVDILKQQGFDVASGPLHLSIENGRKRMEDGLKYYLGDKAQWLPAYDKVVEWLSDNKGRGLLCIGTTGLGKTLICRKILPVIFGHNVATCTAMEMNNHIDDLLKERIVIIDDLGKEAVETRTYGNVRTPFFELCNAAERDGKILIITTNLSTTRIDDPAYPDSIEERYGPAVLSRLRAITKPVKFSGKDMRT